MRHWVLWALISFVWFSAEAGEENLDLLLHKSYIDYPRGCAEVDDKKCLLRVAKGTKFRKTTDLAVLDLGSETSLVIYRNGSLTLMQGELLIQNSKVLIVKNENVQFLLPPGSYLLNKSLAEMVTQIQVLKGQARLQFGAKTQSDVIVEEGYSIETYLVNNFGHVEVSFPRAIAYREALVSIKNCSQLGKLEFQKIAHELIGPVKLAAADLAESYKSIALRNVASDLKAKAKRRARSDRLEQENARMRRLFRQKNYLDQ